jgi:predicted flap endonuclease-1-like 5' DNA nuclease
MTKKRPFGVTILAILAAIAAILAIIHTLQMLHLFPIRGPLGVFAFFTFDILGAILWGILALIYIWVTVMLWNLDPQGWLFVAALSALNLIMAVISILGQSTWQAMLPAIIVNGLILLYTLLPGTKDAFGVAGAAPVKPPPAAVEKPAPIQEVVKEETAEAEEVLAAVEPEVSEPVAQEVLAEAETPAASMVTGTAATSHDLAYVEGIGEVYAGKLEEVGVETPQALLERGATPKGRKDLAEESGISEHLILKWVNHVDLYRIKGVGSEYADLLEASGVDTVIELAQRNPTNLTNRMLEVNSEKNLVRRPPTLQQVEDWVEQAKNLPRMISY